jgi:hypothetical protein
VATKNSDMKKLVLFLPALLFGLVSFGQNTKQSISLDQKQEEKIEKVTEFLNFEKETVDYGQIEKGSDPYRVFEFTNTSESVVLITSARGSCGCTVPTYPKEPIAPGGKGEIKVRYDTNRVGAFKKTVTLSLKDAGGQESTKVLTISGTVSQKAPEPEGAPLNENNPFKGKN